MSLIHIGERERNRKTPVANPEPLSKREEARLINLALRVMATERLEPNDAKMGAEVRKMVKQFKEKHP